jgi:ferric-dicitrate binding protein FerR (iron transport regulator)
MNIFLNPFTPAFLDSAWLSDYREVLANNPLLFNLVRSWCADDKNYERLVELHRSKRLNESELRRLGVPVPNDFAHLVRTYQDEPLAADLPPRTHAWQLLQQAMLSGRAPEYVQRLEKWRSQSPRHSNHLLYLEHLWRSAVLRTVDQLLEGWWSDELPSILDLDEIQVEQWARRVEAIEVLRRRWMYPFAVEVLCFQSAHHPARPDVPDPHSRWLLNSASKVEFGFTPTERYAQVLAGELFMDVLEPCWPFTLMLGGLRLHGSGMKACARYFSAQHLEIEVLQGFATVDGELAPGVPVHKPQPLEGGMFAILKAGVFSVMPRPNIKETPPWIQPEYAGVAAKLLPPDPQVLQAQRRKVTDAAQRLATLGSELPAAAGLNALAVWLAKDWRHLPALHQSGYTAQALREEFQKRLAPFVERALHVPEIAPTAGDAMDTLTTAQVAEVFTWLQRCVSSESDALGALPANVNAPLRDAFVELSELWLHLLSARLTLLSGGLQLEPLPELQDLDVGTLRAAADQEGIRLREWRRRTASPPRTTKSFSSGERVQKERIAGMLLQLKPESRAQVSFGLADREVQLHSGLVLLQLDYTPHWPFVLKIGEVCVRAQWGVFGAAFTAAEVLTVWSQVGTLTLTRAAPAGSGAAPFNITLRGCQRADISASGVAVRFCSDEEVRTGLLGDGLAAWPDRGAAR